jgi:hypothetical protein
MAGVALDVGERGLGVVVSSELLELLLAPQQLDRLARRLLCHTNQ